MQFVVPLLLVAILSLCTTAIVADSQPELIKAPDISKPFNPEGDLQPHLPYHRPIKVEVIEPKEHNLETPNKDLRTKRGIKFPQPQKPQRPRPVPLPKPVPRPPPSPPLRIRRNAEISQSKLIKSSDILDNPGNSLLNEELLMPHLSKQYDLENPNGDLRIKRGVKYPQPRPVPLPKPVPRPPPSPPLRIRRDVEIPQPKLIKSSNILIRPDNSLLNEELIMPHLYNKNQLGISNADLRIKRGAKYPQPRPVPLPKPVPRPPPSPPLRIRRDVEIVQPELVKSSDNLDRSGDSLLSNEHHLEILNAGLRMKRGVKYPQPRPVPLPKPVPRPPPSPPLRIRRDVGVPQPKLLKHSDDDVSKPNVLDWPGKQHFWFSNSLLRNDELSVPKEQHLEIPNADLRIKRDVKYPQPQRPQTPRSVPLPKPVPRPPPSPPLRIRRDVVIPQPKLIKCFDFSKHDKLLVPQSPKKHHLQTPNPPLRMEREIRFDQQVPPPRPTPTLRLRRSIQMGDTPFVPKWPYQQDNNPFKIPQTPVGPVPYINRPDISPFSPRQRFRRFVEGEPKFPIPNSNGNQNPSGWEINPNLSRDKNGNTKGKVDIIHHGENGDLHGSWDQNLRGPDKHSETWSVGGSYRWP